MLQSDNSKLLILQSDKSKNSWLWVLFGGRRWAKLQTRDPNRWTFLMLRKSQESQESQECQKSQKNQTQQATTSS